MRVIFPPRNYLLRNYFVNSRFNTDKALFFLGGPILGGSGWQLEAAEFLDQHTSAAVIACPTRIASLFVHEVPPIEPAFTEQLDWEAYFMMVAAVEGCLIFWLPKENRAAPRDDGRPYAMMTRDEIGVWRERLSKAPHLNVVFGIEDGFPGKPELVFLHRRHLGDISRIGHSLRETLDMALEKAPWCQK